MAKRKAAKAKTRSKAKRAPAKKRVAKKTAARPQVKAKPKAKAKAKAKPASRPKTVSRTHAAGTFCWAELSTSSLSGAETFYSSLLGWKIETSETPGGGGLYGLANIAGKSVAGMRELGKEEPTPPNWGLYVAVEDVDATFAKAKSLGATPIMPPFDIPGIGRMAVFQDPTGAFLAIWYRKSANPGFGLVGNKFGGGEYGATGTFCWGELLTTDTKKAAEFYTKLFGWKAKSGDFEGETYTEFQVSGKSIGGMMTIPKEAGPMPPNWGLYFAVKDCDRSVETAKKLGATLLNGPMDIEETGRFAVMMDPQGAAFSIIKLDPKLA